MSHPEFGGTFLASFGRQHTKGLPVRGEQIPKSWAMVIPKLADRPAESGKRYERFSAPLSGSMTLETKNGFDQISKARVHK